MNFHKSFNKEAQVAFNLAEKLASDSIRCKLYKENGLWVVERN